MIPLAPDAVRPLAARADTQARPWCHPGQARARGRRDSREYSMSLVPLSLARAAPRALLAPPLFSLSPCCLRFPCPHLPSSPPSLSLSLSLLLPRCFAVAPSLSHRRTLRFSLEIVRNERLLSLPCVGVTMAERTEKVGDPTEVKPAASPAAEEPKAAASESVEAEEPAGALFDEVAPHSVDESSTVPTEESEESKDVKVDATEIPVEKETVLETVVESKAVDVPVTKADHPTLFQKVKKAFEFPKSKVPTKEAGASVEAAPAVAEAEAAAPAAVLSAEPAVESALSASTTPEAKPTVTEKLQEKVSEKASEGKGFFNKVTKSFFTKSHSFSESIPDSKLGVAPPATIPESPKVTEKVQEKVSEKASEGKGFFNKVKKSFFTKSHSFSGSIPDSKLDVVPFATIPEAPKVTETTPAPAEVSTASLAAAAAEPAVEATAAPEAEEAPAVTEMAATPGAAEETVARATGPGNTVAEEAKERKAESGEGEAVGNNEKPKDKFFQKIVRRLLPKNAYSSPASTASPATPAVAASA